MAQGKMQRRIGSATPWAWQTRSILATLARISGGAS